MSCKGCQMHRQHLDAGCQCCPSAKGQSVLGLCHTDFTLLAEVHIQWGGSRFHSQFVGSSCSHTSERSFVCLAVKSCPYCPLSWCALPVAEHSPLAHHQLAWKAHGMLSGFPSFMDPPHCLFLISLDSIFLYFHFGVSKHPYEEIVLYLPPLLLWLLTICSFGKFCLVWS